MKKKTILTSISSLMLCASLITGATYALFTSESKTNIAITSGSVEVKATLEKGADPWVYSPTLIAEDGSSVIDATNAADVDTGYFLNGGQAIVNDDGTVDLNQMTPGDKVSLNVKLDNDSNVTIQYHTVIGASVKGEEDTFNLADVMVITVNSAESYTGDEIKTEWSTAQAGEDIADITIDIEMPIDTPNDYKGQSISFDIGVVAVQGNTSTGVAEAPEVVDNESLTEAIEAKVPYTITEGTFTKTAVADGVEVTIEGGKFENQIVAARNGATVTIKDAEGRTGSSGQNVIANVNSGSTVIFEGGNYPLFNFLLYGDGTGTVIISGGYFDGGAFYSNYGSAPVASLTITGGTFGPNFMFMAGMMGPSLSDFVPDTHQIVNNADQSVTVVAK